MSTQAQRRLGPTVDRDRRDRRRRTRRNWPICPATGKQRLGERKDAKMALEAARHHRAIAELSGRLSGWTVRREYQCEHCRGWHLTSIESWEVPTPAFH